jgi:pyrroline-5-carboxylate reductase
MKLGFIGTGKIASSVITGICGSSIKYSKICISSRNSKIAKGIAKRAVGKTPRLRPRD